MLAGSKMKTSNTVKHLGDYISTSLANSVQVTVNKRVGISNHSVYEIRSLIDDQRANALGGLSLSFLVWEMAVIPSLIHNSENWLGINKKTINELEKIQLKHLRVSLAVGTGCPTPLLYAQTGTLTMANRIIMKKLLFLYHVASLPVGTIARDLYESQLKHEDGVSSLVTECAPFLREFGIQNIRAFSKHQYKTLIKKKIHERNKSQLVEMSRKYKKIDFSEICEDNFKMKPYFKTLSTNQARWKFRIISHMTRLAMNYRNERKFRDRGWLCLGCQGLPPPEGGGGVGASHDNQELEPALETDEHLFQCRAGINKNLSRDEDLILFYQQVCERRASFEE